MKERDEIDARIVSFLSGEATPEQTKALEEWIHSSDEHRAHFEAMENAYFYVPQTEQSFDSERAWHTVQSKMEKATVREPRLGQWKMWAAAVVLIALCSWWLLLRETQSDRLWAANERIEQHQLPNGIGMTLRQNTTVSWTEDEHDATVELKGEAYFDIPNRTDKPFFVKTESVIIRDIGTAFRVRNFAHEDTMYFNVDEGIIVCYANSNDSLRLKKGESGYYCRSTKQLGVRTPEPNESSFATKKLDYDNAQISDVIDDLKELYGVDIIAQDPDLLQCRISVSFDQQRIEEIMEVIAITMNWNTQWDGQRWNIQGLPCQQPL